MQIIPAILSDDLHEVKELLNRIVETGKFARVQVDFIDGKYANNKSVRVEDLPAGRQGWFGQYNLKFDAHLMVVQKNVDKWVEAAENVGFDRIIVQMESVSSPEKYKGLAIDVHSPVEAIEPYVMNLEVVVVMAVEPGFGGQRFEPETVGKISYLRNLRSLGNLKYRICVDGGVEKGMLEELEKAGADEVAVGVKRVLSW